MILLFITILIIIALWNAYVILWKTENQKKYSKIWHALGLILRVLIWASLPLFIIIQGNWRWPEMLKYTAVFVAIGGVSYDFIINLVRYLHTGRQSLWYVDNKGWNAFFLKYLSSAWYWIIRLAFVLATVIILFL